MGEGVVGQPVADALRARGIRVGFSTGYDVWALPDSYRNVPRCEKPITWRECQELCLVERRRPKHSQQFAGQV